MADKISVLIQSILEAPTQENINKVKSQIQSAIGNVTSKTGSKGIKLLNQEEIDIYIKKLQNEIQRIQFRTPKVFDNEAVKKELNNLNIEFDKLRNGETTTKKVSLQMDNLKTQIVGASSALKNINKDGYSFTQMLELAAKKIAIWGLSTTLVYGVWRQIKQGISYISELDNSLNEIRIVTNKTQQEVNNLALSYNKLAKEMNVTTKEVASTAADLFRQGLDEGQVEERMKAIIQYAKISSISLEESNKIITATANATGESVQKIIDVFAYLGDMTASGAEEIGEALQKVASTAENSGVSLEKAASWIATISSITRESASVIGNSLKSIISRYEQIKAEGFNEEDATQINDVTKALKAVGIAAVDAQGQLRPIAEVLDELGAKWDGLTKNEKAYVATTLGGTYQRNRLITLLDNYNDSLKNYETALNSAGTAEEKFAIYQDSVQAKLDKLNATWEEFWQKSLNSELIKGTIQALTTLIDTFGNLQTVLSLVVTGFALWKGTQITKWFTTSKVATEGLRVAIIKTRGAIIGMTEAEIAAKTATTGLTLSWNALKVAFLSNPLGWITVGITAIISLVDIFNQKQEEMRQKIEESAQKAKEQSDRITELMGRYNQVIDLVGEDKNARDQLQSIQSELVKTLGLEKEAIDLVNDSRGESIKKVREEAMEKLKANENALIAAKNLAEEEKKNKKGSSSFLGIGGYEYVGSPILSDKENKAFNLLKSISGLRVDRSALGTFILMSNYMATAEERAETLETALKALKDAGLENTNVFNQLARSQQGYNDVINKAKEATDAHNKNIAQQLILQKENEIGIPKTVQELENFRKAILDNSSGTEDFKRVLDELLSQEFPQFKQIVSNTASDINAIFTEKQSEAVDEFQKSMETIKNALSNLDNLSSSDIIDLMQQFPQLSKYGYTGAEGVEALAKALKAVANEQFNNLDATLQSNEAFRQLYEDTIDASESIKSLSEAIEDLQDTSKLIEDVKKDIKELGSISSETLSSIASKYPQLLTLIAEYNAGLASSGDIIKALSDIYKQDTENFRIANNAKIEQSSTFYKKVYDELPNYIKNLANAYNIDLENFKNVAEAKAKINDKIVSAWNEAWKKGVARYGDEKNMTDADLQRLEQNINRQKNIKDLYSLLDEINSVTTKFQTSLDLSLPKSKSNDTKKKTKKKNSSSKFQQELDLIAEKIKVLQNDIDNLNSKLEKTTSIKTQISLYDQLIKKQSELSKSYKKAAKAYEKEYSSVLSKLSKTDQKKVKSGAYTIEQFSGKSGEKRYNLIKSAIELRDQLADATNSANTSFAQMVEYAEKLASINTEKAGTKIKSIKESIDLLETKLQNTKGYVKQNQILDKILSKQKQIVDTYKTAITDTEKQIDALFNKISKKNRINSKGKTVKSGSKIATGGVIDPKQLALIVEYNKYIDALKENTYQLALAQEEYKKKVEETAKNLISTLLNTQKDIDKKNLDNQLKEREKQIYDITEAEFEAYKKAKIESLKKQKEENEKIATEEAKELVRLLTEQIKLEESISYKDIVNFGDLYKEIHNEKIKQYQDTIDMLERSNELEQQRLEREERILEIQELQLKLQNTLNNRNVQILRKKEDGSWEYDYVADPEKVEELQKQIAEKQKDFDEWERNNSLKQIKESLQQKIEQEQELIRISEETYNRIAEIETTKFNEHYENMDILAENMLDNLKNTYSNKWDEIINVLEEKVSIAEREYAKLLGASAAGVSVEIPNTDITVQTLSTGFDTISTALKNTPKFEKGGLVDFTGPAWVDGSKTKPEAFLNSTETKLIGKLADSLPNMANILNNFATTKMKLPSLSKISNNNEVKQIFNIGKLEFPNVRTADEIKTAILDLPRLSLQSAKAY